MCPACISAAAWMAVGATSTSGVAALVVNGLRGKNNRKRVENMSTDISSELPKVVSREAWLRARKKLLAKEKEWNRQRDALSAERRKLPMVRLQKEYGFEGATGRRTLGDLFEGRRQLLLYHFMFDPEWDEGCPSCSFVVDHFAG